MSVGFLNASKWLMAYQAEQGEKIKVSPSAALSWSPTSACTSTVSRRAMVLMESQKA